MPSPIALARSRPPRRPDVYPRTRLYRWLDQARAEHPFIWVSSPPGAGKTALIDSYLTERGLDCAWYSFTAADAEPARFIQSFAAIVAQERCANGRKSPRALSDKAEPAREQFLEMCRCFSTPALVLDDCHALSAAAGVHELLCEGLAELPAGAVVIFISRNGPSQAFTRQFVNQRMQVLGWEGMRLTPEESLGIARLSGCKPREHGAVLQMHEMAAGWVAGFVLMLRQMKSRRHHAPHTQFLEKSIQDYFSAEVFNREDEETRRFLVETAQLPSMTAEIAGQLTGNRDARRILEELCHKQHFTEYHERPHPVYQYHPLFRRFLQQQAAILLDAEAQAGLLQRSAELLETGGHLECAALQLVKLQDWVALTGLVARHAATLLHQGRAQTIESWLQAMPVPVQESSPWVLYWLGVCRHAHAGIGCRARFEQAYAAFERDGNLEGVLLSWAGVVDVLLAAGEYPAMEGWIARLDGLLEDSPGFPTRECEWCVTTSMFNALLQHQPARDDLHAWAERLVRCLHDCADDGHIVVMTRLLLRYHVWFGGSAACTVLMDALRVIAAAPGQAPHIVIQCCLAEGQHAWFTAAHEDCLRAVRKALDIALESGLSRWNFELYGLGVCASIGLSKPADAQEWLHKMSMALFSQSRSEAAWYHYLSSWHAMARGDLAGAQEQAELAHRLYSNAGVALGKALVEAGLAHIECARGERQRAGKHLARAQTLADETDSAQLQFVCGLVQHHLAQRQCANNRTRGTIARMFAIAARQAFENTYWWQPRLVTEACAAALAADIETDYVRGLVRRYDLTLDSPPLDLEQWPWLIRIYTLGRFSLLKQGQPLWASRKAQHKPLEMLKVLIAYGGREVSEDLLASVLWPDAEGDAAHNAFDITLHRLRKLIGHDKVIVLQDGRLTLDARYCWVDTWAFERLIGQAEQMLRGDGASRQDPDAVLRISAKILSLYQGYFLGKEYFYPWALALRERLRSKYLRHVTDMGRFLESRQMWEEALVYYQKGLEVDDLAEQFYQSLMICYRQMGRRNEALAVYRRCRSTLSIVLGLEPTPATETIRSSLLS